MALLAAIGSALVLASCSGTTTGPTDGGAASTQTLTDPLQTTLTTPAGSWAVLAMGELHEAANTFWQLFFRPATSLRWSLVTPPGVADNGGLAVGGATGKGLTVGVEPSDLLEFSPIAQTTDGGASWTPGALAHGLSAFPDALAGSPGGALLALVRAGGGEVLASTGDPSAWTEILNRDKLSASAAGRACLVAGLTSVAVDSGGQDLVGARCAKSGVVGVFSKDAGSWGLLGPRLPPVLSTGATEVLRLSTDGASKTVTALVAVATRTGTSIVALWGAEDGAEWQQSEPLSIANDEQIVSTGIAGGGEIVLLTKDNRGALHLATVAESSQAWRSLPSPPSETAGVVLGGNGSVEALAVNGSKFTDWRFNPDSGVWGSVQTMTVPIVYGSSS